MIRLLYNALLKPKLDLTLPISKQISVRIIEKPGLWMDADEVAALLADLRAVAKATLKDGELAYGILTGDPDRLGKSIVTVLRDRKSKQPIAFNALATIDVELHGKPVEVLHMGLVMVDPTVRSQGFSWVLYGLTCLILFARNQLRPLWLSNVTQVPAIVGMVTETFSNVYPSPKPDAHRSFEHLVLAQEIMLEHRHVFGVGQEAGFDAQRFVITNAYTGGSDNLKKTYDSAPKHRNETFNAFCKSELNYIRGDDVLQLCQINMETARRFILKDVPKASLPAVLGALLFISLNKILLPALYWLSPSKAWGVLRSNRLKGRKS
jgi:hypothetical protein